MKYITRNQENTINLNLKSEDGNTYSGTYIFNLTNYQTNDVILLTQTDISPYSNQYQQFLITTSDTNNLQVGQHTIKIYDIDDSSTIIFQDIWNVGDVESDDNTYFFIGDDTNTVFDVSGYTNAVPNTPVGFSVTLLSTGIDIKLSWLNGSPNTNSFDIWRKEESDPYLNISTEYQSLTYTDFKLNYDTTYTYKLRGKNDVGYSDFTNEISILTEASGSTGITHTYIEWSGSTQVGSVGTYLDNQTILSNEGLNYTEGLLNVDNELTSPIINTDEINIYPTTISWNSDAETLDVTLLSGVTGQMFQELYFQVKNATDDDMIDGVPVMFAGAVGASGKFEVQLAIADGSIPPHLIAGITTQPIDKGEFGKITWFGNVRGIQTDGVNYGEVWTEGDLIYVSPYTAGWLTNVPPNAPHRRIEVSAVVVAHNVNGTMVVRPSWLSKLNELDDVNGIPLDTTGQILVWDETRQVHDFSHNILDYLNLSGGTLTGGLTGTTITADDINVNNDLIVDGNVGIGTDTPLAKLHISGGTGSLSTGLVFGDGDTGIYESIDDNLYLRAANSLSFIFTNGSNQSRHLIPFLTNTYNLGASTRIWNRVYTNNIDGSDQLSININGDETIRVTSGTTLINNDLNVSGNIIQNGSGYTTHFEHIYTKNDFITMRDEAVTGLPLNDISGLAINKADGVNTVVLGSDSSAVMRVGWSGETLQAIATREDSPLDGGITYWSETGTTLQTDSNLHWDDVNKRLGIGTDEPDEKIRVDGNIKAAGDVIASQFKLGFAGSANLTTWDTNENLTINPNGSGNVLINPTYGNVGIGTTTPTSKLEVKTHPSEDRSIIFTDTSGNGTGHPQISSKGTLFLHSGSGGFQLQADMIPSANNNVDLGTPTRNFSNGYVTDLYTDTTVAEEVAISSSSVKKSHFEWNDVDNSLDLIFD